MTLTLLSLALAGLAFGVTRASFGGIVGFVAGIVSALVTGPIVYAVTPTLGGSFYDMPLLLTGIGLLGLAWAVLNHITLETEGTDVRPATAVFGIGAIWAIALFIASLGMLNPKAYRGVIEVTEKPLDASVEIIDQTHARLVDQTLAQRRALELLGAEKGLGSTYAVGNPTVQIVKGRQVWVAPLEPAGFFAWLNADATPGYVVVSATNYSDARIVLDHPLRFTRESWFDRNVLRRTWAAAPATGQTDTSFELDEDGKPYWVTSTYENLAGGDVPRVTGVIVIDAATGAAERYAAGSQPSWIDRIQPEWIAERQLEMWGDYVHGFWNWGLQDVVHPTSGLSLVNLTDGRSAWFTGIVNARSQKENGSATNGFALVDTRTGKATVYYQQGISESAAQAALEGAVQQTRYRASVPIAYLVHGALTYVSTLKDNAGNPRLVGMVSALDRSVVATGQTLDEVTRAYAARLRTSSERVTHIGAEIAPEAIGGTLVRAGGYVLEGRSYQRVRLAIGDGTRDFDVDLSIAALREVVLARQGDRVDLKLLATGDGTDEIRELKVTFAP